MSLSTDLLVPQTEETPRDRAAVVPGQVRPPDAAHPGFRPPGLWQLLLQGGERAGKGAGPRTVVR